MFIQEYVGNKDELKRKIEEYIALKYDLKGSSPTSAVLKKKKYSLALLIILLLLGLIFGILYYLLAEEYTVNIEINPQRAGEANPLIPDPKIMPLSSLKNKNVATTGNSSNNQINNTSTSNSVCKYCGAPIQENDKFCVECGSNLE